LAFNPVNAAGLFLVPTSGISELLVYHYANGFGAVAVAAFLDEKRERSQDSSNLVQQLVEAEALDKFFRTIK